MLFYCVIAGFAILLIGFVYHGYHGYIKKQPTLTKESVKGSQLVLTIPPDKTNKSTYVDISFLSDETLELGDLHVDEIESVTINLRPGRHIEMFVRYYGGKCLLSDFVKKHHIKPSNGAVGLITLRTGDDSVIYEYPLIGIRHSRLLNGYTDILMSSESINHLA